MRKRVLLLVLFVYGVITLLVAQDTLVFRNGKNVIAKIIEIESDKLKYKKKENLNGPTYSKCKDEIAFIIYHNGSKDEFNNINETKELLTSENIIERISKKGSRVYIESGDKRSLVHAKAAIEHWGFWIITDNKLTSDFVLKFIYTSFGLGNKKGKAQFIDPINNNIVFVTSYVYISTSSDMNTKRGVIDMIVREKIKPLIK